MQADPVVILEELDEMRRVLTGLQAAVTTIKLQVAALDLTPATAYVCERPSCGLSFPSSDHLLSHLANVHGDEVAHDRLMALDGVST